MKDYRVEVKVKNNYLFSMMKSYGIENVPQLGKATGISINVLYTYLNLTKTPHTKKGHLLPSVEALCSFFSCAVDDLFPPQHIENPLEKNSGVIEANMNELVSSNLLGGGTDPLELLEKQDAPKLVSTALEKLNRRERMVIEARFGLDGGGEKTLQQIAEVLDVCRSRAREIEAKALRKLRHHHSADLAYAYNERYGDARESIERNEREVAKREVMEVARHKAMEEYRKRLEVEQARARFSNLKLQSAYDDYNR